MSTVLAIAPHFPSLSESRDGQANYLTQVVPALAKVGRVEIQIIALQIGKQPLEESGEGWSVKRVSTSESLETVFDLYLPRHLKTAVRVLTQAAVDTAQRLGKDTPVWCHGYETGEVVQMLTQSGHHVVAVPHYSVGVETLHDLALGDDRVRREAFDSPWATRLSRLWPRKARSVGVRMASRVGPVAQYLPAPSSIQTQFTKLNLERLMVANASKLVAVGPSFETELNHVYPCTVGRSTSVIAGSPEPSTESSWPAKVSDNKLRVAMIGRPTGQKGWDYAAEAIGQLKPEHASKLEVALIGGLGAGNGPYSSYSTRVAEAFSKLNTPEIFNLGERPHGEVLSHLAAADLLLFPSVFEPLGLVLLEAMTAKCCVLASDAAGPSDLLESPWGTLMSFRDPEQRVREIRDGLASFLDLDRASLERRKVAAGVAGQAHTWEGCARVHLDALMRR